ncbi:MAG: hypothetical protein KDD51_10390 [Bdellovibrionales bacterium]|nr:hypothetical protein [Bdellovibrionales bacterium]
MIPNSQSRFWRRLLVLGTCVAGAGASGYFLYVDLTGNALHEQESAIARVTRRISKVRKKAKASFLWQSVNEGTGLQRKDSLQVGEASAATVKLKNDTLLEIGEHSLVIIDDVPPLEMQFVKGSFLVRGQKEDFRIHAEENKAPVIEKIPVRLLSPASYQDIFVQSGEANVVFEWLELGTGDSALQPQLQVSRTDRFNANSTQTFSLQKEQSLYRAKLRPGRYFWRLVSPRLQNPEVREFKIQTARSLNPVYPQKDQIIQQWTSNREVEFRWVSSRYAFPDSPRLQIATTDNFEGQSLRVDEAISAERGRTLVNLEPATYYWRLTVPYPQFLVSSPVRTLRVESVQAMPLALGAPEQGAELPLAEVSAFRWQFPVDNTLFEFEVEQVREEKTIASIEKKRLSGLTLSWRPPHTGSFRWRVAALHQGQTATASDWRYFSVLDHRPIGLVAPDNKKSLGYWKELPEFSLEWENSKTEKSQRYHVRVGKSPLLQEASRSYTPEKPFLRSSDLQLADGKYYWNVVLEAATGEPIRVSETRTFSIGLHPLLQAPKALFPKNLQTVNVVRSQGDPALEWEPVPSATQYEVRLLDKGGRELASATTEETRFPLKAIKQGEYRWTVRAIDPLDRGGIPLPHKQFKITYGDPLKAPEILGSKVE